MLQTRDTQLTVPSDIGKLVTEWQQWLELEYSEHTMKAYVKGLKLFRKWLAMQDLDVQHVKPSHVIGWRGSLKPVYSVSTINLWLTAVRSFYDWLVLNDIPLINPAKAVKGERRRGSKRHKRDELTSREVMALFQTCDFTPLGRRDAAILSLMAYCGLRVSEVAEARVHDLVTMQDTLVLFIRGKGSQEADEYVAIPPRAESALKDWLSHRKRAKGPLFWSFSRRNKGQQLTSKSVRWMVSERMKQAGIVRPRVSPHSLRHSFISNMIRHGATPLQAQSAARHSSFETTLGYYHQVDRLEAPGEFLVDFSNGV